MPELPYASSTAGASREREIRDALPPGRPYVQFTYSKLAWRRFHPEGLVLRRTRRVLVNIPPAAVMRFERS